MTVPRVLRPLLPLLFLAAALPRLAWAQAEAPIPPAINPGSAPAGGSVALLLAGAGDLVISGRRLDRAQLAAIYQKRDFRPLWNGAQRAELVAALAGAPAQGLDPGAFALPDTDYARSDILLTDDFLRYAQALSRGRVSPAGFETDWLMPQPSFDASSALARALKDGVAKTLDALAPSDPAYARLRQAYARYKAYAADQAWRPIDLALPLKPGDSGADVAQLRRRLEAEGFLAPGDPNRDAQYDGDLQAAVARFQATHGLPADGAVGRATLTALNIAPGERVREIRLNLERSRSLPRGNPPDRVEVNVPDSSLVLYENGNPALVMRAVVGAADHPTPVLETRMIAVTLNPPWIVPGSIIVNEIRPALKKDPGYLARNDYAYVDMPGGRQLIQRPGPGNALGRIKFEMPNPLDIYLHDTPLQSLMDRQRRALSHGCIRVGDPRGMARLVLASYPNWTADAIDAAIAAGKTQSVKLPQAVPVYIFYRTAYVDADGTVEFRNDLYGRDRRLNLALVKRDLAEQLAPAPHLAALPGKS